MKGVTNGSSVAMAPSPIVTGRGEKGYVNPPIR